MRKLICHFISHRVPAYRGLERRTDRNPVDTTDAVGDTPLQTIT
jgi:hypothetical protein